MNNVPLLLVTLILLLLFIDEPVPNSQFGIFLILLSLSLNTEH